MKTKINNVSANRYVRNVSDYFKNIAIADKYMVLVVLTIFFSISAIYSIIDISGNKEDVQSYVILNLAPLKDAKDKDAVYISAVNGRDKPVNITVYIEYTALPVNGNHKITGTGEYTFKLGASSSKKNLESQRLFSSQRVADMKDLSYRIVGATY